MIPKYLWLKEKINENILSEKYPLGSKLPTEVQLAKEFSISRSTVRQALELLEQEGIISKHWGSGNIVISKSDSSKKRIVRVLIPNKDDEIFEQIVDDISSTLLKEGFQIELLETKGQFQLERQYLNEMLTDVYGGLIISPSHSSLPSTNSDILQFLLKRQTPVVFLGTSPANIYNPTVVSFDNYSKGYQMARELINSGHEKIGGIFLHDSAGSMHTSSGFLDAIRDANLQLCDSCFLWCNSIDPEGINTRSNGAINRFLKNAYNLVTAVYIDDDSINMDNSFPIIHCDLTPAKSLGKEAAKVLLEIKKNGNSKSITIPYK